MPHPIRAHAAVSAAYWAAMLSDGALRMLVLLQVNAPGFSPLQLAWLFLLHEHWQASSPTLRRAGWRSSCWPRRQKAGCSAGSRR